MIDYVYPVRPGENEELRYSLRSLSNLPKGRVWIVGDKPDWVTNVEFIKGNHAHYPQRNQLENLIAALEHKDMGDRVVIMNDDFYVTRKTRVIPNWYRDTLDNHIKSIQPYSWWYRSLVLTRTALAREGINQPLSYELHKPVEADRHKLLETLYWCKRINTDKPPQWRTAYGNQHKIGGTQTPEGDGKLRIGQKPPTNTFLSTSDRSFTTTHTHLKHIFANPSPFET